MHPVTSCHVLLQQQQQQQYQIEQLEEQQQQIEQIEQQIEQQEVEIVDLRQQLEDATLCRICYSRPLRMTAIFCGHFCACQECVSQLPQNAMGDP